MSKIYKRILRYIDSSTGKPALLNLYFSNHSVAYQLDLANLSLTIGLDVIELSAPIIETALPYVFIIKEVTRKTTFEQLKEIGVKEVKTDD